jgi:hypothetical protein
MVLLACDVVLALLVKVDDEDFLKDDDDDLEELLGWDEDDLEVRVVVEKGRVEVAVEGFEDEEKDEDLRDR